MTCSAQPGIIPQPARMEVRVGEFELRAATRILTDAASAGDGKVLAGMLRGGTGFRLGVGRSSGSSASAGSNSEGRRVGGDDVILIRRIGDDANREIGGPGEGYGLEVTPKKVTITAKGSAGAFYAFQTIRQLLPREIPSEKVVSGVKWTLPCVKIEDAPRFGWRGLMLDVGRHFQPVEFVKKFIDGMALHKFNVFHWHLTEDQGWRIEIKKYPRLTKVGSRRAQTVIGRNSETYDGTPHGGFYTQDEIRDVVKYAAARHITIVPEIEMPGHAQAAVASYPELACAKGPFKVMERWGISRDVYCAGNEAVFGFLEDVLSEVMGLFPGKFIHIGGDECPKERWEACPKCKTRMKAEGLKDGHELQSYLVRRIERFLAGNGRRLIGWDEILEGGLAPGATVMSWRGVKGGITAVKAGHDAVMAPMPFTYFNFYQGRNREREPLAFGHYLPLGKAYQFEPVPKALSAKEARHILGAQGQLWSEYLTDPKGIEYMTYPRAAALAEVLWSPAGSKDYPNFLRRLGIHLKRLDTLGICHRRAGQTH